MKVDTKLSRAKKGGIFLCFGSALGMSIFVGTSSFVIGALLSVISIGVCVMVVTGRWRSNNT